MRNPSSKAKGDFLEQIVTRLCQGITNAKVESDVKVPGASGVLRQIDTLVTGTMGAFELKIAIDSKNHADPVDINQVESMAAMLLDVGANLGVIVCPSGFTDGAKKRAESAGVQLYEAYDEELGNTNLFIPLRYIEARVEQFAFRFTHSSAAGSFEIPMDQSRWQFHIEGKQFSAKDVPLYLWNKGEIAQAKGKYVVNVGAVKITDTEDKNRVQYCDLEVDVVVVEDHYLKLFPATYLRKADEEKRHYDLRVDIYSKKEDMLKNGWRYFETMEEMNASADIENQPADVREWVMRSVYTWGDRPIPSADT